MNKNHIYDTAVIVTCNRKCPLATASSLLSQSVMLSEIITIDDASTDGTHEFFYDKGNLRNKSIRHCLMDYNLGGASMYEVSGK